MDIITPSTPALDSSQQRLLRHYDSMNFSSRERLIRLAAIYAESFPAPKPRPTFHLVKGSES